MIDPVTALSFAYALVNIGASWFLNQRCKAGPYLGIVGAVLGFSVGFFSVDAKGLMLNTPMYLLFGVLAIRSGLWTKQPWFRHKKEKK